MTSDRFVRDGQRPGDESDRVCVCGQSLDCCHRAHCPRCGELLRSAA